LKFRHNQMADFIFAASKNRRIRKIYF
jgi:hypothetical protein